MALAMILFRFAWLFIKAIKAITCNIAIGWYKCLMYGTSDQLLKMAIIMTVFIINVYASKKIDLLDGAVIAMTYGILVSFVNLQKENLLLQGEYGERYVLGKLLIAMLAEQRLSRKEAKKNKNNNNAGKETIREKTIVIEPNPEPIKLDPAYVVDLVKKPKEFLQEPIKVFDNPVVKELPEPKVNLSKNKNKFKIIKGGKDD